MNHRTTASIRRSILCASLLGLPLLATMACGTAPTEATGSTSEGETLGAIGEPGRVEAVPSTVHTPTREGTVKGTYPGESVPVYQGGPMLSGTIHIRPIFYGNSWQPNYQAKMTSFMQELANTSYWQVVQGYTNASFYVDTAVEVSSSVHGASLTSGQIATIVQDDITAGAWPLGNQYIYVVYTGDEVFVGDSPSSRMCTQYGGFHYAANFSWTNLIPATITLQVPYAFIGSMQYCNNHPSLNPPPFDAGAGALEWDESVNGSVIDESIAAEEHELAEAVTDPFPLSGQYGWYPEIGDICAWQPGPSTLAGGTYSDLGNGEPYKSTQVGYGSNTGPLYLVQTIWDPGQKGCAYGPVADDATTYAAACGNWACGTASNGIGGAYDCGNGCQTGQTCSSTHVCTGTVRVCHGAAQCCAWNGGEWNGHVCL